MAQYYACITKAEKISFVLFRRDFEGSGRSESIDVGSSIDDRNQSSQACMCLLMFS